MRRTGFSLLILVVATALAGPLLAGGAPRAKKTPKLTDDAYPFDRVMEKTVERERLLAEALRNYSPRVETYIQNLDLDKELGNAPFSDNYYLGRLEDIGDHTRERSMIPSPPAGRRWMNAVTERIKGLYAAQLRPQAFAPLVLDPDQFDTQHYRFEFVRGEFLGDVRCLVIDVIPRQGAEKGWFEGRIWVEDHDYNIVRFNGTFSPNMARSFHFDSWRQNMQGGQWLPSYIYSEESELKYVPGRPVRFKAATRVWGYDMQKPRVEDELTRVTVESAEPVRDSSDTSTGPSPVLSQRQWLSEAENNIADRLQKAGLLAPPGSVDKVLDTVVNNLIVTNHLDNLPAVHCRILLTTPLESTAIGNTLVLSRGLVDVLPDEASLAMVLAHELSHVVLGHTIDSQYGFTDRLFMSNEELLSHLNLRHSMVNEFAADHKAMELLKNSPYKDKLGNAGLFLRAAMFEAQRTPALFTPRVGDPLIDLRQARPLVELINGAPKLQRERLDQISALPLGTRVNVNPWDGEIELVRRKPMVLYSAREKLSFEVTPLFFYLTRMSPPKLDLDKQAQKGPQPAR